MEGSGELRRVIGFWGGTALIVGTVIGSGIFRTPASIAKVSQDPFLIMVLWVAVGGLTLCGALCLAELGTLLPRTGGTYVYLRAAYGDAAAFVFGWLYLVAAIPSGLGALGIFFGELVLGLFGFDPESAPRWGIRGVAIGTIVFLSAVNVLGAKFGATVQKVFTVIKVAALLGVIAVAFAFSGRMPATAVVTPEQTGILGLAAALAYVLFTYNGWVYIGMVAGEIVDPERKLKRILVVSTLTLAALYVTANFAYFAAMPVESMPGKKVVAQEIVTAALGPVAGVVLATCIMASVFGAMNGGILTKSRVAYALARDGLSFSILGRCHPHCHTLALN